MLYSVYGTAGDYDEVEAALERIDSTVSVTYQEKGSDAAR
jgi:hypothetical protein